MWCGSYKVLVLVTRQRCGAAPKSKRWCWKRLSAACNRLCMPDGGGGGGGGKAQPDVFSFSVCLTKRSGIYLSCSHSSICCSNREGLAAVIAAICNARAAAAIAGCHKLRYPSSRPVWCCCCSSCCHCPYQAMGASCTQIRGRVGHTELHVQDGLTQPPHRKRQGHRPPPAPAEQQQEVAARCSPLYQWPLGTLHSVVR